MTDLRDFDRSRPKVRKRLNKEAKSRIELPVEYLPRVHDLEEIATCVALVSEIGDVTPHDMGRAGDRGLGEILHAAKILNLLDSNFQTTRRSKDFHKRSPREQLALISVAVEKSQFAQLWMKWLVVSFKK